MGKQIDWLEAIAGGALVLAGGVDLAITTVPGAILIADAFGVELW